MFDYLLGLEIAEARKRLGMWWLLESQQLNCNSGGTYVFHRAGQGTLVLTTDIGNIVRKVERLPDGLKH